MGASASSNRFVEKGLAFPPPKESPAFPPIPAAFGDQAPQFISCPSYPWRLVPNGGRAYTPA